MENSEMHVFLTQSLSRSFFIRTRVYVCMYVCVCVCVCVIIYLCSEVKDRLKKMRDDRKRTQSAGPKGASHKAAQKGRGKR